MSKFKKIGWIGTGVMGNSMCKHLLNNNYQLNIYNRTIKKTEQLQSLGATLLTPSEIAQQSDIIFLMLGYPEDVQNMIYNNLYDHLKPGQIIVDHTTSSPVLAQSLSKNLQEQKQVISIDAPVTGGDLGAQAGKLTIMCGGPQQHVKDVFQIMNSYGAHLHHVGAAGLGQHTKMGNQIVIAGSMIGVVEGLLYAHKAGLNESQFIDIIKNGSAASFSLSTFGPKMVSGDFKPGFYVEHFVKDMDICLQECKKMNLSLPGLALVRSLYEGLLAYGNGRMGTQALVLVLEKLNNLDIRKA